MAMKAKKLHGQASQAHGLFQSIHTDAKAKDVPVGHSAVTTYSKKAPISGPIGAGGKKPMSIVEGEPQQQGRPNVQVLPSIPTPSQVVIAKPSPIGGGGKKPKTY